MFEKILKPFKKSFNKVGYFFKTTYSKTKNLFKNNNLLKKILFTLLILLIFRIAATITMPAVKVNDKLFQDSNSFLGMLDLIGGGSLNNLSIVALGISPYISASIIMSLLQTEAFPPIYRLAKSGPAGKRKINIITRVVTLFFAILQSMTIIQQFALSSTIIEIKQPFNIWYYQWIVLPMILLAGSLFTLFLSEQITNKGVGNGTSLIMFSGIAVGLPNKIKTAFFHFHRTPDSGGALIGWMSFILYLLIFMILLFVIGYFFKSERHIPIQQTGSGLTFDKKQLSFLPIKFNPSGVMPIIFATTIIILPTTIAQFFSHQNEARIWIQNNLQLTSTLGIIIFVSLTFLFSIVMSLVTFNPFNVADNFKKNGTFIPGINPGEQTEQYLTSVVLRLSIVSGIYLSLVSSIQYFETLIGIPKILSLGGTSLIIMMTVSIETLEHLKARDTTQSISKARIKTISLQNSLNENEDNSKDTAEGLLW